MIAAIAALWRGNRTLLIKAFAVAIIICVLAVVNHIYRKGEKAGASGVTNAVQTETIRKIEDARHEKNKTDEAVRNKPIDEVIERLK